MQGAGNSAADAPGGARDERGFSSQIKHFKLRYEA
jgi:hypothetical protein